MYLKAPGNEVTSTNGITLGGASINGNAPWQGKWSPLEVTNATGCMLKVEAATAAIVKFGGASITSPN
jgi:hypothetical protein